MVRLGIGAEKGLTTGLTMRKCLNTAKFDTTDWEAPDFMPWVFHASDAAMVYSYALCSGMYSMGWPGRILGAEPEDYGPVMEQIWACGLGHADIPKPFKVAVAANGRLY